MFSGVGGDIVFGGVSGVGGDIVVGAAVWFGVGDTSIASNPLT